ncbi:hydrogenase maturation protease [Streptomyces sannanensis]|uniref:Hydrogenase maturation protease n=1 Tax=Streptomyces sannanensis TaxID=285536 RepID=A0ABP6S4N6_9ACTN
MTGRVVVIGVGNPFRRDDGVGPAVVEALRAAEVPADTLTVSDGEPARMLDLWGRQDTVVIVEAVHAHPGHPGRLHTLRAEDAARYASDSASSHALGLGETIALAAALDRLPRELVVHAVEGADFTLGTGLSPLVRSALPELTRLAADTVRTARA